MEFFKATLNQTVILFVFIVVGFIIRRTGLIGDGSATVLSKLETNVFIPALIVDTFMNRFTVENIKSMYPYILWSGAFLTTAAIIAIFVCKLFSNDEYVRRIFYFGLVISNFGFMGNAVVLGAFGEEMLFRYMLYTIPFNVFTYSIGVAILKPTFKFSPKTFVNPVTVALVLGALLGVCGAVEYLPSFVTGSVNLAKSCMSPVAMLLTGIVVAGYNIKELLLNKKVYICTAVRLILIPSLLVIFLKLIGVGNDNHVITLTICCFAMPLGLNTVVYPAAYGADTKVGASMALISHTLSIITIPILFLIFT